MRRLEPGLKAGRLDAADYVTNFSDLHPRFGDHEALVASDRCYFCHDAPCMTACPTAIDIPMFIRQISTGNPLGAANHAGPIAHAARLIRAGGMTVPFRWKRAT